MHTSRAVVLLVALGLLVGCLDEHAGSPESVAQGEPALQPSAEPEPAVPTEVSTTVSATVSTTVSTTVSWCVPTAPEAFVRPLAYQPLAGVEPCRILREDRVNRFRSEDYESATVWVWGDWDVQEWVTSAGETVPRRALVFDAVGRIVEVRNFDAEGKVQHSVRRTVDAAGRPATEVSWTPDGVATTTYTHDAAGRLLSRHVDDGHTVVERFDWAYDAAGRLVRARGESGDPLGFRRWPARESEWTWDDAGRPVGLRYSLDGELVVEQTWVWDEAGRLVSRAATRHGSLLSWGPYETGPVGVIDSTEGAFMLGWGFEPNIIGAAPASADPDACRPLPVALAPDYADADYGRGPRTTDHEAVASMGTFGLSRNSAVRHPFVARPEEPVEAPVTWEVTYDGAGRVLTEVTPWGKRERVFGVHGLELDTLGAAQASIRVLRDAVGRRVGLRVELDGQLVEEATWTHEGEHEVGHVHRSVGTDGAEDIVVTWRAERGADGELLRTTTERSVGTRTVTYTPEPDALVIYGQQRWTAAAQPSNSRTWRVAHDGSQVEMTIDDEDDGVAEVDELIRRNAYGLMVEFAYSMSDGTQGQRTLTTWECRPTPD